MNRPSPASTMHDDHLDESTGDEYLVYALVAEQVERCLQEKREIDVSGVIKDHLHLEQQIRELVPSLTALHQICPLEDEAHTRQVGSFRNSRRTMLGDFALGREIGRGGMGVVYEAIQVSLGRRVALKVLPFAAVLDKRQLQRFKNEAQAAAALHHQNIVPVFAVGCERGVHYYAMQYIDGRDLSAALSQLRNLCGPEPISQTLSPLPEAGVKAFPPVAAEAEARQFDASTANGFRKGAEYFLTIAKMTIQAAEALEYAHQQGIVHRDIKPSNLMLDDQNKIWITDFGLAQIESGATLTGTGDIVGTLRYMSPEQISGRRCEVDLRSDIFALGATLYELVTLQPLYTAETRAELLNQRAHQNPPLPRSLDPSIPLDLETIILKAIQLDPSARYATAREFAADLNRFLDGRQIEARRPNLRVHVTNWVKRNRLLVLSAGILACGFLLFVSGWSLAPRRAMKETAQTAPSLGSEQPAHTQALHQSVEMSAEINSSKPTPKSLPQTAQPKIVEKPAAGSRTNELPDTPVSKRPVGAMGSDSLSLREPSNTHFAGSKTPKRLLADDLAVDTSHAEETPRKKVPAIIPESTPPPPPKFRSDADRTAYVGLVGRLLNEGLRSKGKGSVESAKQYAEEARRLCDDDPRLDYALGLVLMKNFRSQEALKLFQVAGSHDAYPYLPARRAEIWYLLSRKKYDQGLQRYAELAKVISKTSSGWPDEPTRTATAHWMGRLAGYLAGPGSTRKVAALLEQPGMDFRQAMSERFHAAFDAGSEATAFTYQQLKAELDDIRKTAQASQIEKRQGEQEKVSDRREEVQNKQDKIELTTQQWKEWLDDQTQQVDKKLTELEKDYVTLDEQAKSLQRSMQSLDFEIQRLTNFINYNAQHRNSTRIDDARRELALRNNQKLRHRTQHNALNRQASVINQQAEQLIAKRKAAQIRYEKETGQFIKEKEKLRLWTEKIRRRERRLNSKPVKRSAQITSAVRGLKSLHSYVKFDWDIEQQQVLQSYGLGQPKKVVEQNPKCD